MTRKRRPGQGGASEIGNSSKPLDTRFGLAPQEIPSSTGAVAIRNSSAHCLFMFPRPMSIAAAIGCEPLAIIELLFGPPDAQFVEAAAGALTVGSTVIIAFTTGADAHRFEVGGWIERIRRAHETQQAAGGRQ
jgi:hypothetical protein